MKMGSPLLMNIKLKGGSTCTVYAYIISHKESAVIFCSQEGHRQATFWGKGTKFQQSSYCQTKQEPTIDMERFAMLFRYLSPWNFGEHSSVMAERAFRVSRESLSIPTLHCCVSSLCCMVVTKIACGYC